MPPGHGAAHTRRGLPRDAAVLADASPATVRQLGAGRPVARGLQQHATAAQGRRSSLGAGGRPRAPSRLPAPAARTGADTATRLGGAQTAERQQWADERPSRLRDDSQFSSADADAEASSSGRTEDGEDGLPPGESAAEIRAWQQANRRRGHTVRMPHRNGAKISAAKKGKPGTPHTESSKRRIAAEMRKLQRSMSHRQRISEKTRGRAKVCSLCGEEGHNRRGCPVAKGEPPEQKVSHAEVLERRAQRREERKRRPKSRFRGLSWDARSGRWAVRVWDGRTVKHVGTFQDEEEAAREYDRAVLAIGRTDAALNFPPQHEQEAEQPRGEAPQQAAGAVPLPLTSEEAVSRAVQAISQAWRAGVRRQRVEFLLPLRSEEEAGEVRQEFAAARNLVEATLVRLKQLPDLAGRVSVQWLDKTDCVASWQSERLAAVVFCTADCLQELRNIDGGELGHRLTLVINPQWQIDGQVVSDFGFGRSRRAAEEFIGSFQEVFVVQRRRIMGDQVCVLKCYGSRWQVHYIWPNGRGQMLVSEEDAPPSYERLLALMRAVPGSRSSRSWVERVLNTFSDASLDAADDLPGSLTQPQAQPEPAEAPVPAAKPEEQEQPPAKSGQPDRFAEGRQLLDPVRSLPQWQRQVLGSAFGRDRSD